MRLITILLLLSKIVAGQENEKIRTIDRVLNRPIVNENYNYKYGNGDKSMFEFKMDTIKDELLKVTFRIDSADTFYVDYYFINNYLVKVQSSQFKKLGVTNIGIYYFDDNKLISRSGKNYNLKRKGIYKKVSPKYIQKQLGYIYYQFEYLNLSPKNTSDKLPTLLKVQRDKIENANNKYKKS